MTREELKKKIDELMRQYDNEEIDGNTSLNIAVLDVPSLIKQARLMIISI